jgi:hypothetical protein
MTKFDVTNSGGISDAPNTNKSVKTLIKAIRSESNKFLDRDLVQEFNQSADNKPTDKKSPTVDFLTSVESDLKNINSHISLTNKVGQQYAKLLHNQYHLDNTAYNIQKQTMLNSFRDAHRPIDTDLSSHIPLKMMPVQNEKPDKKQKSIADNPINNQHNAIPMGNIQTQYQPPQKSAEAQYDISTPSHSYQLTHGQDIFSSPKTGSSASYRIVPFTVMTGA